MTLVHVEFDWSDEHGECYECGLPAAFAVPDVYGPSKTTQVTDEITDEYKRCAVCAANAAVEGERVVRLGDEA